MPPELEAQVCVLGGGPAGSTIACRLAALGHSVWLVEQKPFPRPHVGESLTPAILAQLDLLGVRERVEAAGFLRPRDTVVRWAEAPLHRSEPHGESSEAGFQVDRGRFDALLLEAAVEAGTRLLQPAKARRPQRREGLWRVPLDLGGRPVLLRAHYLVDATGRRSTLLRCRQPTSPPTLALYAYWRGVELGGCETRVEAGAHHWFWGAPLPDGAFNATVFLDPAPPSAGDGRNPSAADGRNPSAGDGRNPSAGDGRNPSAADGRNPSVGDDRNPSAADGRNPSVGDDRHLSARCGKERLRRLYLELLSTSRLLGALAAFGDPELRVQACDATCYRDQEPVFDGGIKVGEASYAIDPLSSQGVQAALRSGLVGAAVVHTVLTDPQNRQAAEEFYLARQAEEVDRHHTIATGLYAAQARVTPSDFWRTRARRRLPGPGPVESTPPRRPVEPRDRLRLSSSSKLIQTPVLEGDTIRRRPALVHPSLERPVAFSAGAPTAVLVALVEAGGTGEEVLRRWQPYLPPHVSLQVLRWMWEKGVVERAGGE